MPHYKLTYFNLHGRAETSRFLFHLAGVPYEDVRVDFMKEWPNQKKDTRWGFLPELEVDGKKLAQSKAIHVYLAKQFGFNGKDDWEAARIHEFLFTFDDISPKLFAASTVQDAAKKAEMEKAVVEETIKPIYKRLEQCLEESGTGFLVGNKITVADISSLVYLTGFEEIVPGVLVQFSKLVKYVQHIEDQPKVKEWIEKRPKTPFSIISKPKK